MKDLKTFFLLIISMIVVIFCLAIMDISYQKISYGKVTNFTFTTLIGILILIAQLIWMKGSIKSWEKFTKKILYLDKIGR